MNGETGFWHSFGGWSVSVCRSVEGSEGSSPLGAHLRATDLYAVGWFDPDHDAVMRIGGEAPGGAPILSVGIKCRASTSLDAAGKDAPQGDTAAICAGDP